MTFFSEIVSGVLAGVVRNTADEFVRRENVDAHAGVALVGLAGNGGGIFFRFFLKADDAVLFVGDGDAQLVRFGLVNVDARNRQVRVLLNMSFDHFRVIHFVNVIASEDQHALGALALEIVNVLINRIGRAEVPGRSGALLWRENVDELAAFRIVEEFAPAKINMAVQRERFVLRQHVDVHAFGIEAVGEREIDDAVHAAEGDGGFGAVFCERIKAFALPPARTIVSVSLSSELAMVSDLRKRLARYATMPRDFKTSRILLFNSVVSPDLTT